MLDIGYSNEDRAKLLGSLLLFTRVFFKLRTNREFLIPNPTCRESHVITISRELTNVFHLKTLREYTSFLENQMGLENSAVETPTIENLEAELAALKGGYRRRTRKHRNKGKKNRGTKRR